MAISFAPLEAMLMGCPVIAPRNLDWPLFYDDRVNILLYEEGNYHSCKEVVDYFRSSEQIQLNLSRRGREAVLAMNSAELFTERWTSVLDAALASAVRGVGRLKTDANAPLSKTTLLRRSEKERAYELVTSLEMAGKDVVIGHPAKAWLNPRQLLRKYKSLRAYSPVRYDLMRKHCATKKTAVIVGDDFGLYSLCAAVLGSRVLSFNYHRWSCSELAFTAALNAVGGVPVDHIVFDDMRRPVYVNENRETRFDEPREDKDDYVLQAAPFDHYAARKAIGPIDLLCVDDVNFETRIIRGSLGSIKESRPALLIRCYRHGAHNIGAPTAELLRILNRLDYLTYYAPWDGEVRDLQLIENDVEPTLDTFLLYAFGREYAPFLLNKATGKIGDDPLTGSGPQSTVEGSSAESAISSPRTDRAPIGKIWQRVKESRIVAAVAKPFRLR